MNDPRNHHYVPQAYLRCFSDSKDQLYVRWRVANAAGFRANVRNLASERDFYTFVNDKTGKVDYSGFEYGLNRSETMLRTSLAEYLRPGAGHDITTLKMRIALGVGFQMSRTCYFRRKLERVGDYAARTWTVHHRPDLSEAVERLHFVPGNDVHLKWIADWALRLAAVILNRSWFVTRALAGQFITSDNPVYGIAGHTDALDVGVLAASEIRYPVDPRTAIVWTPLPGHDAVIFLRAGEVADFNTGTFANAFEQAYAHPSYSAEVDSLPRHSDTLLDRLNAMVSAPPFRKTRTRRFDPAGAQGEVPNDDS